jgi:hypothetical protein
LFAVLPVVIISSRKELRHDYHVSDRTVPGAVLRRMARWVMARPIAYKAIKVPMLHSQLCAPNNSSSFSLAYTEAEANDQAAQEPASCVHPEIHTSGTVEKPASFGLAIGCF